MMDRPMANNAPAQRRHASQIPRLAVTLFAVAIVTLCGCGLPTDDAPSALDVPEDLFESGIGAGDEPSGATSLHPIYFLRNGFLVELTRELPKPVFLNAPLANLLDGPTEIEAASGIVSRIPAGTEIIDVNQRANRVVRLDLNAAFDEVVGEQRIQATAQLVYTAYGLVEDAQGVLFYIDDRPVALPTEDGLVPDVAEGEEPLPLTTADFAGLIPRANTPELRPPTEFSGG